MQTVLKIVEDEFFGWYVCTNKGKTVGMLSPYGEWY